MPEENNAAIAAAALAQSNTGEAAFFDVDNTLMKGASLFHVARKMYERRAFTLSEQRGLPGNSSSSYCAAKTWMMSMPSGTRP